MESNFFRCLASALGEKLAGGRIQKIFSPARDTWTFLVKGREGSANLLFRAGRNNARLFLSGSRPVNPSQPPARVMWLRKRISGRRIDGCVVNWPNRSLALQLASYGEEPECFLILDMRQGPDVVQELPDNFSDSPVWPDLNTILTDSDIWREYPQISPPLRRALRRVNDTDGEQAASLFFRKIVFGECAELHVPLKNDSPSGDPLPWSGQGRAFACPIEAAGFAWEASLFEELSSAARSGEKALVSARLKKVRRQLANMEREEERLLGMIGLRRKALALQAVLHEIEASSRLESVRIPVGSGDEDDTRESAYEELKLDPRKTVIENMQRLFHQASRGERGLVHLASRRGEAEREYAALQGGRYVPESGSKNPVTAETVRRAEKKAGVVPSGRWKGLEVHRFRTSDGFIVLRGRNSRANHKLLSQAASPFDFWFHAEDGPGAHCILKRDHPEQDVPERSRREAAALAALKSWQAEDERARVMCALVRDVRKFKGGAQGQVLVDVVMESLYVHLEPGLEDRLRME